MTKPKILLTRPWPEAAEQWISERFDVTINREKPLTRDELKAAMRDYDGICPTVVDKFDAEVLAMPGARVKVIANFGVGFEHIDLNAAKAAGIVVTNTPDVLTEATADIALLLMLMTSRRGGEGERQLRADEWKGWGTTHMLGQSLEGKTLGLYGFGRIARATAHRAHVALGMNIAYASRSRASDEVEFLFHARYVPTLAELAKQSDVLSLHCPGGAETYHIVNADLLKVMKPTAILINTARGSVVDEGALAAALRARTIWAAGLDVYEREPVVHPDLLGLENAVLLPHLGSATIETRTNMGLRAAENAAAFFAGEQPRDRIA
ncbi:MAG TPA: D-glycerate dehydrogenase [Asticcacaulis sp.]|nr:D-glycerate dehydrogenase [Asticcacaulis sp.]